MEMKHIILFVCFLINYQLVLCQSYVYKRNPIANSLEVYESNFGVPTGPVLYKVKRNVYGYLEVENVNTQSNPFTKKPDYSSINNFKPYQLPAKDIFKSLEVINSQTEYDNVYKRLNSNDEKIINIWKSMQNKVSNTTNIALEYLRFFNSTLEKPKSLKNGWYNVVSIDKAEQLGELMNTNSVLYNFGICKVVNNKISEYYKNISRNNLKYTNVFHKAKILISSEIEFCQAKVYEERETSNIYFMDNIIDPNNSIQQPIFTLFTIYTDNSIINANGGPFLVFVEENREIDSRELYDFKSGDYITTFHNNTTMYPCNNSNLTLAFKKSTNWYEVGLLRVKDRKMWVVNKVFANAVQCITQTVVE